MVRRPLAIYAVPRNSSYAEHPVYVDHSQMMKFGHSTDDNYRNVAGNLKQGVKEVPGVVAGHFTPQGLSTK